MLTPKARTALKLVETAMEKAHLDRIDLTKPLSFIVLDSNKLPLGVFWQKCPILWIHMNYGPNEVLSLFTESVAELILRALKVSLSTFGSHPSTITTPYTTDQI